MLLRRIERYYKKAMSCRAGTVHLRIKQEMRSMLTSHTGLVLGYTTKKRALKVLEKFLKEKIGIMTLVN